MVSRSRIPRRWRTDNRRQVGRLARSSPFRKAAGQRYRKDRHSSDSAMSCSSSSRGMLDIVHSLHQDCPWWTVDGYYLNRLVYGKPLIREISLRFSIGLVDQLEDRYLGMVEAASSNLAQSTSNQQLMIRSPAQFFRRRRIRHPLLPSPGTSFRRMSCRTVSMAPL